MKYRYIRMTFKEPLTSDQEGILSANLESIKEGVVHKLNVMLSEIEHGWFFKGARAIPMNASAITALQGTLTHLLLKFSLFVFYTKEAPNVMTFYYARDELALVKFRQTRFANPIQELLVVDGLKRFVFPDMKVDPNSVEITRGDEER